jgi:hypothetical protein
VTIQDAFIVRAREAIDEKYKKSGRIPDVLVVNPAYARKSDIAEGCQINGVRVVFDVNAPDVAMYCMVENAKLQRQAVHDTVTFRHNCPGVDMCKAGQSVKDPHTGEGLEFPREPQADGYEVTRVSTYVPASELAAAQQRANILADECGALKGQLGACHEMIGGYVKEIRELRRQLERGRK